MIDLKRFVTDPEGLRASLLKRGEWAVRDLDQVNPLAEQIQDLRSKEQEIAREINMANRVMRELAHE